MNEKDLERTIKNFTNFNRKKNTYPKINEQNLNAFLVVKNLFNDNLNLINQGNYDKIFSSKDGKFLAGKKWLEILLSSTNIIEYYTNLRRKFETCNQKKLQKNINDDLFLIYYHDENNAVIEATENDLFLNTRKKLKKITQFLEEKDWSNYFFNLQKLMHEQVIKLLDWKGSLNFNAYNKLFKEKIEHYLNENQVKKYIEIVEKFNLYRNSLSKANGSDKQRSQEIINKWDKLTILQQIVVAKEFYYNLIELIEVINLILNSKRI